MRIDFGCGASPGWLAGASHHTGFHGVNPYVNVGVGQILRHINVIYSSAAEFRLGRFGLLGDLLYLNAQAGTAMLGLVSKVDLSLHQFWGELFASPRKPMLAVSESNPTSPCLSRIRLLHHP